MTDVEKNGAKADAAKADAPPASPTINGGDGANGGKDAWRKGDHEEHVLPENRFAVACCSGLSGHADG
jgi:hypothetical protein